ncbi:hypothetical protein EG329_005708 [Mollisiaceae sp. DMI_Dod_QoI]|nr:hypothetical protein EG329_005708 [Helotiales sp. DMI_Dod_QoI]
MSDLRVAMYSASHRTKLKLFEHLKDRRVRLQHFAVEKLSPGDCKLLGLSLDQIPDAKANEIVEMLQQKGWKIPEPLEIGTEKAWRSTEYPCYWGSVYHHIDCGATADMLLALGFKDFDSMDTYGRTPLSQANSPGYALWLIDHGATVTSPLGNVGSKLNQIAIHGVACRLGRYLFYHGKKDQTWRKLAGGSRKRLLDLTCSMDVPDNCRCACSSQGCTPFTALLKPGLRAGYYDSRTKMVELQEIVKYLPVDVFGLPEIPLATLRLLTFEALGIRHTCCQGPRKLRADLLRSNDCYDEEELQELREEDSFLVKSLEELMEEFEMKYNASGENLPLFVERYWKHRMEEVIAEMDEYELSDEEKRKLEELGVDLLEEIEEESEEEEDEMEEWDLNYYIRRMDQIVGLY